MSNKTLIYPQNYGMYKGIINDEQITIYTNDINRETYQNYYDCLLNIFKDGIETYQVQSYKIELVFPNNRKVKLTLSDYWINLIMWYLLIASDQQIKSKDIIFVDEMKQNTIKDYIDDKLIDICRKTKTNMELNNIIDNTLKRFHDFELFAFYLSNTVNLEDNAFLMNEDPDFYECLHLDLSDIPISDVKAIGASYRAKSIDIIKNKSKEILGYDHCLADAFRASQGINEKQYEETNIIIGPKPDGNGGVYPIIINRSFINGGVANPLDYYMESNTGRSAQIIKFNNVGYSGYFARLLGLNNMDSYLHENPLYDCHTKNYVEIIIKDEKTLRKLNNRYYRLDPQGMEYIIKSKKDKDLIGKTIYLRSSITCASAARGHGVCYKCYGDLAYTVFNVQTQFGVNIGRIASEILSSKLTQMLLSAKHMLEAAVKNLNWVSAFDNFFEITYNVIQLLDIDTKSYKMIIDPESIELENEEDDDLSSDEDRGSGELYNEYIVEFDIIDDKNKQSWHICNDNLEKLYISKELNSIIRKKGEPIDGKITISLDELKEIPLFIIPIQNNELSRTLNNLKDLLNKNSVIKGKTYSQLLQDLLDLVNETKINISSIHLEMILSNQIRDDELILEKPDWSDPNPPYQIITLNKALTDNPSVTISLLYQKVKRALYNPLTYKKNKPSFMDLFLMKSPQLIIRGIEEETHDEKKDNSGLIMPISYEDDYEINDD